MFCLLYPQLFKFPLNRPSVAKNETRPFLSVGKGLWSILCSVHSFKNLFCDILWFVGHLLLPLKFCCVETYAAPSLEKALLEHTLLDCSHFNPILLNRFKRGYQSPLNLYSQNLVVWRCLIIFCLPFENRHGSQMSIVGQYPPY